MISVHWYSFAKHKLVLKTSWPFGSFVHLLRHPLLLSPLTCRRPVMTKFHLKANKCSSLTIGEPLSVSEHQIHHISHFRGHEPRVELIPRRNSQLRRLRLRKSKQKRKTETKQNLKLLLFRRNHGVSQPKTLTEALPLFPNATRLSGGGRKKTANHDQDCTRKKNSNSTLPKFQLHVLALFLN